MFAVFPAAIVLTTQITSPAMSPDEFVDRLQELQRSRGDMSAHVHSQGRVEAVDVDVPSITLVHPEIGSPDGRIWMPGMRMTFHVAAGVRLSGLRKGDWVSFVAQRVRGAVTVTEVRRRS
ncbi:copper-binding protein [Enterovirga aerilata]|uniref:Copper-binding protein n=1 Tax=Enterovirga aerilata TaxID=2730920 RepID=A0A849I272_9HYPH|nr:copper-binding protein [Enterovirga sp. DB1703]NNM73906.1 hypothetical protein [Enterovirga sp. DB1703]